MSDNNNNDNDSNTEIDEKVSLKHDIDEEKVHEILKKAKKTEDEEKQETPKLEFIQLTNPMYRIAVSLFKEKKYVSIREYYENADGKFLPGKKGISLNMDDWNILKSNIEEIDQLLDDLNE